MIHLALERTEETKLGIDLEKFQVWQLFSSLWGSFHQGLWSGLHFKIAIRKPRSMPLAQPYHLSFRPLQNGDINPWT